MMAKNGKWDVSLFAPAWYGSRMERAFPRTLEALEGIFAWVSGFLANEKIDEPAGFAVNFAVEEMFVNMVRYNRGAANDIVIALSRAGDRLEVALSDFGVEPFDVNGVAEYDGNSPLEKRRPGGLGIHLTRRLMDKVEYRYEEGRSTITLTKILGGRNV
jgi:anti-sigma regulatory factor (Ser/Thr protein kinase)